MVCALAGNSCCSISASASRLLFGDYNKPCHKKMRQNFSYSFKVRASSEDSGDCNTEECAPDKEVGKVSMEWVAGEKTRVVGTYPPRTRGWTGYVEKDTAGQTNIYSIEPSVYIAESVISSGTAGSSADGSENTVAIVAGIALVSVAAAASILIQVGKNNNAPPVVLSSEYSGPSLSYYISKLKPLQEVAVDQSPAPPPVTESSTTPSETEAQEAGDAVIGVSGGDS